MSNSRMIEAVNRLIGNLLSGAGEVFLPGVGSLYAEQQGAQRVDKHTILPPCRMVSFCSQERGVSLVGEIARVAGVDIAKAEEVYQTWLARIGTENGLTIDGVGELRFKNFTLTPEFDKVLNPAGHTPIKIYAKRRFDWVLWLGIVAIMIAGGLFGCQFFWNSTSGIAKQSLPHSEIVVAMETETLLDSTVLSIDTLAQQTEIVALEMPAAQPAACMPAQAAEQVVPIKTEQQAVPTSKTVVEKTPEQVAASTSESGVLVTVPGHYYVVLGVFSAKENAVRAIKEAQKQNPQWQCRIYRMGAKYMVTPFEGTSETCGQFVGENKEANPGMWSYQAR